ncbi:MAG TPA: thioredoxin family protein [Humisphaera sp.]
MTVGSDNGGGSGGLTKLLVVAFLALAGVAGWRFLHPRTTFAADGAGGAWDAAVARSRAERKPALVLFTADWCGACRRLHEDALSNPAVQSELFGRYSVAVVDLTSPTEAEQQRAERYGVRGIPAMIRFDADGKEVDRTGYRPADELLKWLRDGR